MALWKKHEIQILVTNILETFWQFLKNSNAEFYKLVCLEMQAEMILLNNINYFLAHSQLLQPYKKFEKKSVFCKKSLIWKEFEGSHKMEETIQQ